MRSLALDNFNLNINEVRKEEVSKENKHFPRTVSVCPCFKRTCTTYR